MSKDNEKAFRALQELFDRNNPNSSKEIRNAYMKGIVDMQQYSIGRLKPEGGK